MPLVANSGLPTFNRLRIEGVTVLTPERAQNQYIRELHIGLLNMMPDTALGATERQFYRLVGESNPIAQFYMHPFTLPELERGEDAQAHIDQYYEDFSHLQEKGLDALIITGANVSHPNLEEEDFWEPLTHIIDWALENVTSILCSCLATHAVMQYLHDKKRRGLGFKRWGVYEHRVVRKEHPLVTDVNTRFDVPHSRFNQVDTAMFEDAGTEVLVKGNEADVHLAVSEDLFRIVFFQGHPEYDTISLMKEYKREILQYWHGKRTDYPPFPDHYFDLTAKAVLEEYRDAVQQAMSAAGKLPEFPEILIRERLDNTWHDTGQAIIGNWIGLVYQVTHAERKKPFMDGIDPQDPLNLKG